MDLLTQITQYEFFADEAKTKAEEATKNGDHRTADELFTKAEKLQKQADRLRIQLEKK